MVSSWKQPRPNDLPLMPEHPLERIANMPTGDIVVYYHVAQMGNWREVVEDQLRELRDSGLQEAASKIYVGMLGTEEANLPLDPKAEMLFHRPDLSEAEIPTLEALHRESMQGDFRVLYMHTKGVSYLKQNYNREAMTAWRKYLEYFCIGKWRECVGHLDEYDGVGCEYVGPRTRDTMVTSLLPSHFRGNFWWSKASYLRTLCPVRETITKPKYPFADQRRKAEYWLGTGENFKAKSIFNLGKAYSQRGFLYRNVLRASVYMDKPTTPP